MSDITTTDLRTMLRGRHSGSEWAIFDEVRSSTGYGAARTCDAIAMNLWPSNGLELHGFEIKVSRADWLNELRDPDKSLAFKQHCDRWWLVGSSKAIVKNDLPEGWGFMWPRKGKLVVSRGAPQLDPTPPPRTMIAALLRRASQGSVATAALEEKYQEGYERGQDQRSIDPKRAERQLESLRRVVCEFKEKTGIDLTGRWDRGDIGAAVDAVQKMQGRYGSVGSLANCGKALARDAEQLAEHIEALRAAAADVGIVTDDRG